MDGEADFRARNRRWRVSLAAVLVSGAAVAGFVVTRNDDTEPVFCSMEGRFTLDGRIVGRSNELDCQFVDDEGNVVSEDELTQP